MNATKSERKCANSLARDKNGKYTYAFMLKSLNPLRHSVIYVDTEQYIADNLFVKHGVAVQFKNEFRRENDKYILVNVTFWKWDLTKVNLALDELPKKMLICGNGDYLQYCENFMRDLTGAKEKMISGKEDEQGNDQHPQASKRIEEESPAD